MEKFQELNTSELYRFPWSKNDHPVGYVEITTRCNMACPGCYRGCNLKSTNKGDKSLEKIKEEILLFKKVRNCQTISLTGGEPLLHPDILKIVNFVKKNRMNVNLLTNGKLLTKKLLSSLKEAGLDGINLRVDSLREPGEKYTEKELNKLRKDLAEMVNSVEGIILSFNYVVDTINLKEINDVIKWFNKKALKTEILVLIIKRQFFLEKNIIKRKELDEKCLLKLDDVVNEISREHPNIKYSAYIGSLKEDTQIKWLWLFGLFFGGQHVGYLGKKFPEFIQMQYHLKNGQYFWMLKKKDYSFSPFKLIYLLLKINEKQLIKNILKEIIKNPLKIFKKSYIKQIIIVNPPGFVNGERDLCDAGPCCMIYEKKVVPSCVLEEIKKFGSPAKLEKIKNSNLV